jgi:type IV pilus assembly protein PilB
MYNTSAHPIYTEETRVRFRMEASLTETIDLPPPDRRATVVAEVLEGSEVIAHMLDGRLLRGKLKLLSYARENYLLQVSDGPILLSFNQTLYLSFVDRLEVIQPSSLKPDPGSGKELPSRFQKYKIVLKNNEIVNGKMKSVLVDRGGIHIFKLFDSKHVVRIFFPATSVVSSQLGDRIGEALVEKQKVKAEVVDKAVSLQKTQRQKKLGDYLVEAKAITPEALKEALQLQSQEALAATQYEPARRIGEILVSEGAISQESLDKFIQTQNANREKRIGEYLENTSVLTAEDIQMELARKAGVPFVKLANHKAESDAIKLVSRDVAKQYQVMPLQIKDGRLLIAVDDPLNWETTDALQFVTNMHLEMVVATKADISAAIDKFYDEEMFHKDITDAENLQEIFKLDNVQKKELERIEQKNSGAPIVRLVTKFILDAINKKASDIHIRPKEESVDLLFRIDGTLVKMRTFSKSLLNPITSRIKIIGNMDIAERRLPQDGGAQVEDKSAKVDLRISIIPTVEGESAVIRLLNSQVGLKSISDLGFNKLDASVFRDMMYKSYGLVLVTGPTGSGKSTTLYAALKEVIARNLNIITVENPVEFHIDGIEQIQVNTVPGYTFARALRHILRHDPDVIMIGEIRDEETAKIALESALTGHLVLSTLHTNDAAGAITRLLEMGIDPFLLNGTLLGIFAQRLVKRNCENCIDKESFEETIRKVLGVSDDEPFFKGRGCDQCRGTGYSGRIAVYELLQFSGELRSMIHAGITTQEVHQQAVKDGMVPLTQNALALARTKKTSLEEVYRVRLE